MKDHLRLGESAFIPAAAFDDPGLLNLSRVGFGRTFRSFSAPIPILTTLVTRMPDDPLPSAVMQFLARHIATVEELEILLLLARDAGKAWNAEEIYQVVKSSRRSVEEGLAKFIAAGFVTSTGATFSVAPPSGDSIIHELSRCYREMPVRVIATIYQRPRDSGQDFADAFKFRRNP